MTDRAEKIREAIASVGGSEALARTKITAIARYGNRDAGWVCAGTTKDRARARARAQTQMTFVIRRIRVSPERHAAIVADEARWLNGHIARQAPGSVGEYDARRL